jgi:ATPase subunit of ABC transporter with duplicated ATPase domains
MKKQVLKKSKHNQTQVKYSQIYLFSGNYDDYLREIRQRRVSIEQELSKLDYQKKEMHEKLMQEQNRAAKSKSKGEKSIGQRKWPSIVSKAKALRAEETSGQKKVAIEQRKNDLSEQLASLRLPEIIIPKFSLSAADTGKKNLCQITNGSISYKQSHPILKNINFSINASDRIAISGDNGSGKSSLVKAVLADPKIMREGEWFLPKKEEVGYLDQHYGALDFSHTVLEEISILVPQWSHAEIRRHLNDFLFRKNEEVNALIPHLSGGEKARLSLTFLISTASESKIFGHCES